MKVTRERKIYAAVIGLALLGLALDRTIYGSREGLALPQDARAETSQNESAVAPATLPASSAATTADEPSLAARLASVANEPDFDASTIHNPFNPQIPWLMPAQVEAAPAPALAELFVQRHTLSAVMGSGQTGYAIIDGNCVRIGKSMDGFRLLSVDRASATLEAGGSRVKLALKTSVASGF